MGRKIIALIFLLGFLMGCDAELINEVNDIQKSVISNTLSDKYLEHEKAASKASNLKLNRSILDISEFKKPKRILFKSHLEEENSLSFSYSEKKNIFEIADLIYQNTGIQVDIVNTINNPISNVVLKDSSTSPEYKKLYVVHEGGLSDFLDSICDLIDVNWNYDGKSIKIQKKIFKKYRIMIPLGKQSINKELIDETGVDITYEISGDYLDELNNRFSIFDDYDINVHISPGSGRVDVIASPSGHLLVKDILNDLNETALNRISVEFGVYFVDIDKFDDFGLQLKKQYSLNQALGGNLVNFLSSTTTQGASLKFTGKIPLGLNAPVNESIFTSLASSKSVVDYRLASTVTHSGTVARMKVYRQRDYVSDLALVFEKDPSTNISTRTTDYTIESIIEGLTINMLPRLINENTLDIFLDISQRSFLDFDNELYANTNGIQAPIVDQQEIHTQVIITPGETLLLSGYEQEMSVKVQQGFSPFKAIGLGGNTRTELKKVRMVIIVHPKII